LGSYEIGDLASSGTNWLIPVSGTSRWKTSSAPKSLSENRPCGVGVAPAHRFSDRLSTAGHAAREVETVLAFETDGRQNDGVQVEEKAITDLDAPLNCGAIAARRDRELKHREARFEVQ
jgi:hypothetical protein